MRTIREPDELRRVCDEQRRAGQRIGFVPTMGFLHEGHLSLMRRAREVAEIVVVSIFVNPTQFGPAEDLSRYPRDLDGDLAKCATIPVDLVYAPEPAQVYPPGFQTFVEVEGLSLGLCGERRPGHFRGVATVVTKLLCRVGPCVAIFGEKDYQQLQVIRQLARDLELPVEIVGSPTVREPDGLAMSSRNAYLTPAERASAPCLQRALSALAGRVAAEGRLPAEQAIALVREIVLREPGARIDYVEVRDADTLEPKPTLGAGRTLIALAVFFGKTRLIDNRVL
jgi:pantoate--beta-alanine ligase